MLDEMKVIESKLQDSMSKFEYRTKMMIDEREQQIMINLTKVFSE